MAVSVMILGVSGTGKSASMRNCKSDKFALVNVAKKPLPFKGNFAERYDGDNYQSIKSFMKSCKSKSIVIDDAQYLMGNEFMRRVTEHGYDKFSEMAQNMWELLNFINQELPADKIVYLLGHIERDQDGNEKFKTMGKLIDQCINVEGTCTIVLKTHVADGQYSFLTQNSGHDTVKSPIGLFSSYAIDNDLNYVDEKIRNYYELGEFLSDDDIKDIDAAAKKVDIEPEKKGRKSRSRSAQVSSDEPKDDGSKNTNGDESKSKRTRKRASVKEEQEKVHEENGAAIAENGVDENGSEEKDFADVPEPEMKEKPKRKSRKTRESEEPETEESPAEESTPRTRRRRRS